MTGFFVKCALTVWMINPATNKQAPFSVEAICERSPKEYVIPTGAPETFFINCEESIGWLDIIGPLPTEASEEDCEVE